MTAAGRKPGRRYSRESQQEDRSEAQIKERFTDPDLGWPCDRLGRDLGEDLHVRIFDDGQTTGLDFYVQLKSAANAGRLRRKNSPALAYPLETKDLGHWEKQTKLVVLVVWDVEKREGWWRPVSEMIAELDKAGKGWRKKKTATVTVPLANGTDKDGMKRLRWAVADHSLPIVPRKGMAFSLSFFANTKEGEAAFRALELGESITLHPRPLSAVEDLSWRRIYGDGYTGQTTTLEMTLTTSNGANAVRVEVESSEGPAVIPYVELRATKRGRKRPVLTNEHQKLPVVLTWDTDSGMFLVSQSRCGNSLTEARETATFMTAVAAPDSAIRMIRVADGTLLLSLPPSRPWVSRDLAELRRWRDFLDKLCFVQQRIIQYGAISREALLDVTTADVEHIEKVFRACRDGKAEVLQTITFDVLPSDAVLGHFQLKLKGARTKVLNIDVPLGDGRMTILDSSRFVRAFREALAQAKASGKRVRLHLEDLRVIEEYATLLPGNYPWAAMYEALDTLDEKAARVDGYFTRGDARAAGASDAVFDALLAEHKIEPIAADVYHLPHYPHADREDLIVLWLQTDRRGVISHETALYLQDLFCDILPSHLHVTVPPGWKPHDRDLATDVEIRYADIPESDLRWLGPVPYTAPLRTIRDCIEVGVSPEFIEQAIAEGVRRGLFTEADFPHLRRVESA